MNGKGKEELRLGFEVWKLHFDDWYGDVNGFAARKDWRAVDWEEGAHYNVLV